MKKIYLLLLCCFMTTTLKSQDIGIGTKWVYNQALFLPLPGEEDMTIIEIVSDTIINNEQYFVFEGHCMCSNNLKLVMRWEEDKIIQHFFGADHVLYDFSLESGDTLKVDFPTNQNTVETTLVNIDSTGIYNGRKIQFITISQNEESYTDWEGVFVQDFGSINWCMTPQYPLCEVGTYGLCQLITPENDTITFTEHFNCIINSTVEIQPAAYNVYPNPSQAYWIIQNTSQVQSYTLYDLSGRALFSRTNNRMAEVKIEAMDLREGIYLLELVTKESRAVVKLVKD